MKVWRLGHCVGVGEVLEEVGQKRSGEMTMLDSSRDRRFVDRERVCRA